MIDFSKDENNIVTLSFNMTGSPVNVINEASMLALQEHLEKALTDASVKGIIITSLRKEFLVGADLNMIIHIKTAEEIRQAANRLHQLLRRMETSGKPVVAAINGTALGGGFEICLACHYRIAIDDPKIEIGLPEVMLGLLPGGGGTQRLPRLIGIQESLRPLMEGLKVRPQQALQNKMVDTLVKSREELLQAAGEWILKNGNAVQPWDAKGFKIPGGGVNTPNNAMVLAGAAGLLRKKTHGNYPAPLAILNCVYEGLQLPFDRALQVEARYFAQCVMSDEAKNMIRTLFFSMNDANKGAARPAEVPPNEIRKVGILGAGMMGAGIAYVSANAGLEVVLKDVSIQAAEKGKEYSSKILAEKVAKGRMAKEKMDEILSRIHCTENPADVAGCELVVEAVFENRELKASVTQESEMALGVDSVFASNTSTLPITGLARASSRPDKFIGLHFFSPVDKMPLVEIIKGKKSSDYAIAMCVDYVRKIKKTPIVVNDSRGFFTSRVFSTYLFEGFEMLAEGVNPVIIENAAKSAGMPVGPLAVADEVSIELAYKINKQTEADTGKKNDSKAVLVINKFIEELGRPGKKAGKGFYEYPTGEKKYLWNGLPGHFPLMENQPDKETVKKRLLHIQALETVRCLEENVITTSKDGDLGSILGIGFPPYTGGALSYIDTLGVKKFVSECEQFARKYGKRFRPSKRLKEMAEKEEAFYPAIM